MLELKNDKKFFGETVCGGPRIRWVECLYAVGEANAPSPPPTNLTEFFQPPPSFTLLPANHTPPELGPHSTNTYTISHS